MPSRKSSSRPPIERVPRKVIGAIMLATPDDAARIRDEDVKVPRTNVLFETAYLAATIGRPRVALCVYDGVKLITDLEGFTHVRMGPYTMPPREPPPTLRNWLGNCSSVVAGATPTHVWHGYSGIWDIRLTFSRWRDIEITAPSIVEVVGELQLHLATDDKPGRGTVQGTLDADIAGIGKLRVRVADTVLGASHDVNGNLCFASETMARQVEHAEPVAGASMERFAQQLFTATRFEWQLRPAGPRTLTGTYRSARSAADVVATMK